MAVVATVGMVTMLESQARYVEHLECPSCGACYLARDQRGEMHGARPRWFTCPRCRKRVQSVSHPAPEPFAAAH